MQATYNHWLVILSVLVAVVVSYTALTLAGRVADAEGSNGRRWLVGGAIAMGIGIWSMHFIGMLAYSVPIPLRYDVLTTLSSLLIAILTSGFALSIAGRSDLGLNRLAVGALVMGAGICGMHYTGMAAIAIMPAIHYDPMLVGASMAIAITASFAALWLAFKLRSGQSWLMHLARAAAAGIMGLAICGMHYTAMAASMLAPGSFCFGGASFDNEWLAVTIGLGAIGLLAVTLITAVYDAHLDSRTRRDALRLAQLNTDLQHGKNLLTLAMQTAGIVCWEFDAAAGTLWTENELASLRAAGVDTRQPPAQLLALILPEDRLAAAALIEKAVAAGSGTCAARVRVQIPGAAVIHLQAHARIFCDAQGRLARILGVTWDVSEQVHQDERQQELQTRLRDASRQAGMAEVATGVLHNVGNVLNSLNVSASLLESGLRESRVFKVRRAAAFLQPGADEPRARKAPDYLARLGEALVAENERLRQEARGIAAHVEHICRIVAAQQTYAGLGGVVETVDVAELLDTAIASAFGPDPGVQIVREYAAISALAIDRHKLMQILGSLVSNAHFALRGRGDHPRQLTLRVHRQEDWVTIEMEDSGSGISPETLDRLFEFGFTTRPDGHGYGLHTSAILAGELGGEIHAASDGVGRGARFTLRIPHRVAHAAERACA